ncbi:hypothetical protein BpHYR1_008315 [Brachionus plicatilis]|uniref:Uncharacterized protein n=1 Tax=Brachionus plicatilis TaxID=10195 RepID=A0A3M7S5I5_BRAPC|nr:hypothetical protein BpHYR1_008315 [Brachionus plicatilis]
MDIRVDETQEGVSGLDLWIVDFMDVQPLHPCAKFTFQWTDNGPQIVCIIVLVRNAGDHDVVLSHELATFLNPKYKKFSNSSEEKKKIFTEMAEKLIRDKITQILNVLKFQEWNSYLYLYARVKNTSL